MTKDEALKLALEALECLKRDFDADQFEWGIADEAITAIKEALAQKEQEPLAWISTGPASMIHWTADKPAYGDDWVPLYTAPPQRKPLTDEDVERIVREARVKERGVPGSHDGVALGVDADRRHGEGEGGEVE